MAAATDPFLPVLVSLALVMVVVGIFMRVIKQPHVIGYIVVGILIGPSFFGLLERSAFIEHLGSLGIVLLLFFIGMHVSLDKLIAKWRIAIIGTLLQIAIITSSMVLFGHIAGWGLNRGILMGFVVSISSTAVVLKILEDRNELETNVGQNALSILLVQDLAIIPMIITIDILSGQSTHLGAIALESIGGVIVIGLISWLVYKRKIQIPFRHLVMKDHEIQLFIALFICFGLAFITGFFGLSTALGAFVAGILVAAIKEEAWIQKSLSPFYIVFVAIFFIYIGLTLDITFIFENYGVILSIVLGAFLLNTVVNSFILRALGDSWKESLYAGALLAQIGEFSFLLGAIAFEGGMVSDFAYQLMIASIALTLFFSPFWIGLVKKVLCVESKYLAKLSKDCN